MSVLNNTLREPKGNLFFGALNGVRSMANVTANSKTIVTTNGTDWRLQGVGSTKHDTSSLDSIKTLPYHGNNGSRGHVLDEAREERLALEVGIMLLKMFRRSVDELEGDKLVPTLLESRDDLADQVALHAIRLDHDVGAFCERHGRFKGC